MTSTDPARARSWRLQNIRQGTTIKIQVEGLCRMDGLSSPGSPGARLVYHNVSRWLAEKATGRMLGTSDPRQDQAQPYWQGFAQKNS